MTAIRAVEIMEARNCCPECVTSICDCSECDKAFEMAIAALRKLEPRQVQRIVKLEDHTVKGYCPNCNVLISGQLSHFCKWCGQAVKWNE